MTSLFLEGFDHYGPPATAPTAMLQQSAGNAAFWAELQTGGGNTLLRTPSWGARTGTYAMTSINALQSNRVVLAATKSRIFMSLGFSVVTLPPGNFYYEVCRFRNASNGDMAVLWIQANGSLVLTDPSNTVLAATQGPVIAPQNWSFLEMDFNQGTGAYTLRVDDPTVSSAPAISATGLSLGSNPVGMVTFCGTTFGPPRTDSQQWVDDIYIRDTLGTVNNGWLGDRRIATLFTNADTSTIGWTPEYYHNIGAGILNDTAANACVSAATATSLNVGAGDFTIEGFVRFQALPTGSNNAVIFGKWDVTANQRSYQFYYSGAGNLVFQTSTDGTNATLAQPIVYPWSPALDTWYHFAVVRASSEDLLFINGQQLGLPINDALTYFAGAAPLGLGGQVETAGGAIANTTVDGWFDEVRFTVGYARYTANFTPPTTLLPRGAGSDPQWADVALLCGFDSLIQDESGFARALTARNGATQMTVSDGPSVGVWSTIGKITPDDNTSAQAALIPAASILTLSAQPANGDTVTVGTKAASTPAVYTFKTTLASAFDVLIDTTLQQTLQNLYNAIDAGPGAGTKYGTSTTANLDVTASQLPAGQMLVTANTAGTVGNSIASSVSLTHGGSWSNGAHLAGGANIPGPSDWKVQRPPPLTTIISAVQATYRAFKSDAGACSINSALVGGLGGKISDAPHNLTVSPVYYADIYEADPDTGAAITPATLINGALELNRDT